MIKGCLCLTWAVSHFSPNKQIVTEIGKETTEPGPLLPVLCLPPSTSPFPSGSKHSSRAWYSSWLPSLCLRGDVGAHLQCERLSLQRSWRDSNQAGRYAAPAPLEMRLPCEQEPLRCDHRGWWHHRSHIASGLRMGNEIKWNWRCNTSEEWNRLVIPAGQRTVILNRTFRTLSEDK